MPMHPILLLAFNKGPEFLVQLLLLSKVLINKHCIVYDTFSEHLSLVYNTV